MTQKQMHKAILRQRIIKSVPFGSLTHYLVSNSKITSLSG